MEIKTLRVLANNIFKTINNIKPKLHEPKTYLLKQIQRFH